MNQTRLASAPGSPRIHRSLCLAAVVFLSGAGTVCSQPTNKPAAHAGPQTAKTQPGSGYLSKAPPPGLRFAAPPKPPVAYLPPLPISYDPQPIFSSEFAPPTTEVRQTNVIVQIEQKPGPTAIHLIDLVSNLTTNRLGNIPATPIDLGSVSPQMLVRFFQNGKVRDVELLMTNAVNFRVPVREEKPSSSASYEVAK